MNTELMGAAGRPAGHQPEDLLEEAEGQGRHLTGDHQGAYTTSSSKVGQATTTPAVPVTTHPSLTFTQFKDTLQGQSPRSGENAGHLLLQRGCGQPSPSPCSGGNLDLVFSQSVSGLTGGSLTSGRVVSQQPFDRPPQQGPHLDPSPPGDLQVVCSATTTTMTVGPYEDAPALRHPPQYPDNQHTAGDDSSMVTYYSGNHGNLPVVMADGGQGMPGNQYALQQHNNQQHHPWQQHLEGHHQQLHIPPNDLYSEYEGFDPQPHLHGYQGDLQPEAVFRTNHAVFPHPADLHQQNFLPAFVDQDDSTLFFRNVGCYNFAGVGGTGNGLTGSKPKRRRVPTLAQRRAANIRERRRMYNLNEAFDALRTKVPTFAYEKRLSRIETLRLAMTYISFMSEIVNGRTLGGGGGPRGEGEKEGEKKRDAASRVGPEGDDEGEDKENRVTETLTDSDPDEDLEDDVEESRGPQDTREL